MREEYNRGISLLQILKQSDTIGEKKEIWSRRRPSKYFFKRKLWVCWELNMGSWCWNHTPFVIALSSASQHSDTIRNGFKWTIFIKKRKFSSTTLQFTLLSVATHSPILAKATKAEDSIFTRCISASSVLDIAISNYITRQFLYEGGPGTLAPWNEIMHRIIDIDYSLHIKI